MYKGFLIYARHLIVSQITLTCTFCEVPRILHKLGTKAGSGNSTFSCCV